MAKSDEQSRLRAGMTESGVLRDYGVPGHATKKGEDWP